MTPDVNYRYEEMPISIKAFTRCNPDNTYTIVMNPKHSYETLMRSCKHELDHIARGDYDRTDVPIQVVESEAHGISVIVPSKKAASDPKIRAAILKEIRSHRLKIKAAIEEYYDAVERYGIIAEPRGWNGELF